MRNRITLLLAAASLTLTAGCRQAPGDALAKAEALFAAHDYQAARVEIMNALQADPTNVKALLLNARNALELGEGAVAERAVRLAEQAGADESATRPLLIRSYLQQMLPERALEIAGEEASEGDSAELYRLRGLAYAALEKKDEAAGQYEAGLAQYPRDASLIVSVARLRYAERDLAAARKLAADAAAIDPASLDVMLMNADAALASGDLAVAQDWFGKAAKANPRNLQIKLGQATVLWQQNDRKGAMALAEEVLKADPRSPVAIMMKATTLADAGKEEEALALMKTTIPFFENDPTALRIKGDLEMKKGYPAAAARFYEQAVRQQPEDNNLRFRLARALIKDGDTEAAGTALAPAAAGGIVPADLQPYVAN